MHNKLCGANSNSFFLMGHLTMVRYKNEVAGEYKTPREIYNKETAQQLYHKAEKIITFVKNYTRFR